MQGNNELKRADTDTLDKDAYCPYWRCQSERSFQWFVNRGEDGTPVEQEWKCEECGRNYEWAMRKNKNSATQKYETAAWRT